MILAEVPWQSFAEVLPDAEAALAEGDALFALEAMRAFIEYPGHLSSGEEWHAALDLLARATVETHDGNFCNHFSALRDSPDDVRKWEALGRSLLDHDYPGMAATVLARSLTLAPTQGTLVELVAALELVGGHDAARDVLRRAPAAIRTGFLPAYLEIFDTLMSGEVDLARALLSRLPAPGNQAERYMRARLVGVLHRYDALAAHAPLDASDLRGWHWVLTGGIVLVLAPESDGTLHGRWSTLDDSWQLVREGLERLALVLEAWGVQPACVSPVDGDGHLFLGRATAERLDVPFEPALVPESRCLAVRYQHDNVIPGVAEHWKAQRPGQILWSHALRWTRENIVTPDLVTCLYDRFTPAWGDLPPPSEEARSAAILAAEPDASLQAGRAELVAFARFVGGVRGPDGTAALRSEGERARWWVGSPVKHPMVTR